MSDNLLLSTDNDDLNDLKISSNPTHQSAEHNGEEKKQVEYVNSLPELLLTENDSLTAILKRIYFHWRRILWHKIRLFFSFIFISALNITTRITCFTHQRTQLSPPSPSASITTVVSSASIRLLEEDSNDLSKSPLLVNQALKQDINLTLLEDSKMAHIIVRQQSNPSPNININRSAASKKDTALVMSNSVDDRRPLNGSKELLHLLQRFASEPQISKHSSSYMHTNGSLSITKPLKDFTISIPISTAYLKTNQLENDDINHFNCDKLQLVSMSSIENLPIEDKINNSPSITTNDVPEETASITDEIKNAELNEEILFDMSPTINENDPHSERHFRRRKRRSSLTKTSISLDDTQPIGDALSKDDSNSNKPQTPETVENVKSEENDNKENVNVNEGIPPETKESNQTMTNVENAAAISRYRGRRLRHRFYRHAAEVSSTQPVTSNASSEFYLPNEALNVKASSTLPTSTVAMPSIPLPISSKSSPRSKPTSPIRSNSNLKRTASSVSSKKSVRFADTVGRQLTHVQYIQSSNNDESHPLSFLLDSSFLSSSPPTFLKNNLYLPSSSNLEHKPWSFDVVLPSNKQKYDKTALKRYFCLYRQPSSEHPDIYLHEIWKSQIKLEYADIPMKYSLTGEQQLNGTLWVANIGFEKHVFVKYTFNRWLNICEHEAQYSYHSNDHRNIDQFQFSINIPKDVDRVDFVLRYCVNGNEYWDNNNGKNYSIQTESNSASSTISLPHDCDFNEMRFY